MRPELSSALHKDATVPFRTNVMAKIQKKKIHHSPTQTTTNSVSPTLNYTVHAQSWLHSQFSQLITFYTSKPITYKSNSAHITSMCSTTYVPHPRTIYIQNQQCTHNPNLILNIIAIQNQQSSQIPHLSSKNCL